jgi:hypothetical protein
MFLVKVTRNRGRSSMWVCPLGAVQMIVICLMLIMLKPKFSRLLVISATGMSGGGKVTDYCLYRLFGIWGEGKIVEIIFLEAGFHG